MGNQEVIVKQRVFVPFVAALAICSLALAPSSASAQQPPVLTDRDRDIQDAYEVMSGVTMGLIGVTAIGGLAQLYNLPTAFGEGACSRGEAIFGDYACERHFSLVHGGLGILTAASYTATAALALAAPDLDQGSEDTVTDVLGVVHGVGIGLTGIMGLLAANPGIIGLHDQAATEFSRVMRVVHAVVAVVTAGAFATHLAVDHID